MTTSGMIVEIVLVVVAAVLLLLALVALRRLQQLRRGGVDVALRRALIERGVELTSDTDAEVVAHLVGERCAEGHELRDAVVLARMELDGHFAFVALHAEEEGLMVATRH